ncbi:MAG: cation transporter [Planctomycetales bacterium]|nr:cation transporter [Planctomycetales bacterium]
MRNALKALPGVAKVEADAATRTATLQVDATKFKTEDAIAKLAAAGFADSSVASTADSPDGEKADERKKDESKSETN